MLEAVSLPPDPIEPGSDKSSHGFILEAKRNRHPHAATSGIDLQMQVLDVLADYLHGESADLDIVALSSHAASIRPRHGPNNATDLDIEGAEQTILGTYEGGKGVQPTPGHGVKASMVS